MGHRSPIGRVVANLDAEADWARQLRPGLPRPNMSRAARRRMAVLGSLLRTFCRSGEALWLPSPIFPDRLPAYASLPTPQLEFPADPATTGGHSTPPTQSPVRLWGITREWPAGSLHATAEAIETVEPAIAARVNDRAHTLELSRRLGCALPHSRLLRSPAGLAQHLDRCFGARSRLIPWVLKAPLSAAGRHRLWHFPGRPGPTNKAVKGLFQRHGELLFEPWMERVDDYGALFIVTANGLNGPIRYHRQRVDPRGGFRGIELQPPTELGLDKDSETLRRVLKQVADQLASDGYRGPVAVDFWRYRDTDGQTRLHPLGEVNARASFGWVARSLAQRWTPAAIGDDLKAQLLFGNADSLARARAQAAESESVVVPLILPVANDPIAAWLQLPSELCHGL